MEGNANIRWNFVVQIDSVHILVGSLLVLPRFLWCLRRVLSHNFKTLCWLLEVPKDSTVVQCDNMAAYRLYGGAKDTSMKGTNLFH